MMVFGKERSNQILIGKQEFRFSSDSLSSLCPPSESCGVVFSEMRRERPEIVSGEMRATVSRRVPPSFSPLVKKCIQKAKIHRSENLNKMREMVSPLLHLPSFIFISLS
jgi:hypothetical protein